MTTIPQRTLRNEIGKLLRRAEAGERFMITVDGRPVAELGPVRRRRWVSADAVRAMATTPTDPEFLDDIIDAAPGDVVRRYARREEIETLADPRGTDLDDPEVMAGAWRE